MITVIILIAVILIFAIVLATAIHDPGDTTPRY